MLWRSVFAIAGCYLTARFAPNRPMRHALMPYAWLGGRLRERHLDGALGGAGSPSIEAT